MVTPDANQVEQEVLLKSYRSAREIRLACWRYRLHQAELEAAFKEIDEVVDEVGRASVP